jgi:hypothetical protein
MKAVLQEYAKRKKGVGSMKAPSIVVTLVILLVAFAAGGDAMAQKSLGSGSSDGDKPLTREPILPTSSAASAVSGTTTPLAQLANSALPLSQPVPLRHLFSDVNADGLKDLFVLQARKNILFENRGSGDFKDVTAIAFPDGAGNGGTAFFGDYNADGKVDLFLFLDEGFRLFRNDGDFRFSDVTDSLGLPPGLSVDRAELDDIDGDGLDDLLVHTPQGDGILRNQGGNGFAKVPLPGVEDNWSTAAPSSPRDRTPGRSSSTTSTPLSPACNSSKKPPTNITAQLGPIGQGKLSFFDPIYINDNSPGSVGVGIPEVEGGDDGSMQNDIVDGSIWNSDIRDDSITSSKIASEGLDPSVIIGTAATLSGDQNFDSGTLFVDTVNDRVGINTTAPQKPLHVISNVDNQAIRAETSVDAGVAVAGYAYATGSGLSYGISGRSEGTNGRGVFGLATATDGGSIGVEGSSAGVSGMGVYGSANSATGYTSGIYGVNLSDNGYGVRGRALSATGSTYGIHGQADSDAGTGVLGRVPAATGATVGVRGESASDTGTGVKGQATAASGATIGVHGETDSTTGVGVFGESQASSGATYGIHGRSLSTEGTGVFGVATATTGGNAGVWGSSSSPYSRGVIGHSSSPTGPTVGVYGLDESSEGTGVRGYATSLTGTGVGVLGETSADSGIGVKGWAQTLTGPAYGVHGQSDSFDGIGVRGSATYFTGATYGVLGESESLTGIGVKGWAQASAGLAYGVLGQSDSIEGIGVHGEVTNSSGDTTGVMGTTSSTSNYAVGVAGESQNGTGVRGVSGTDSGWYYHGSGVAGYAENEYGQGVVGLHTQSGSGTGVHGETLSDTGTAYGVFGRTASGSGAGVRGETTATDLQAVGVEGRAAGGRGVLGVLGDLINTYDDEAGVVGVTEEPGEWGVFGSSLSDTGTNVGVFGKAGSTGGEAYGVVGQAQTGVYGMGLETGVEGNAFGTGVIGTALDTDGTGVFGEATATSGVAYGVEGHCASSDGAGVYGHNSETALYSEGPGIYGKSDCGSGHGVYGKVVGGTTGASGVYGISTNSCGVRGVSGSPYGAITKQCGVQGITGMDFASGVVGDFIASDKWGHGVEGNSRAEFASGVFGWSWEPLHVGVGVRGRDYSPSYPGTGVIGTVDDNNYDVWYGENVGVAGLSVLPDGVGVTGMAIDNETTCANIGVYGLTDKDTADGIGVKGEAPGNGFGVYSVGDMFAEGDIDCSGNKLFVHPHPNDPSKEIRFVCLEGNESGTYFRGTGVLSSGVAVIEVPEEFRLVTEPEGLTVQFTPAGPARLWFEEKNLDRIVVCGDADVEFDYFVNGVRRGYANHNPIGENRAFVPKVKGEPFGTQYREAYRELLVENGILNPDFTPNETMAARMGWKLEDPEEHRPIRRHVLTEEQAAKVAERLEQMKGESANEKDERPQPSRTRKKRERPEFVEEALRKERERATGKSGQARSIDRAREGRLMGPVKKPAPVSRTAPKDEKASQPVRNKEKTEERVRLFPENRPAGEIPKPTGETKKRPVPSTRAKAKPVLETETSPVPSTSVTLNKPLSKKEPATASGKKISK